MPTSTDLAPSSVEELSVLLRDAGDSGSTVSVHGSGSKSGWAAPTAPTDLTIDMHRMDAVVEHAAGDLVVTAQAGMRLADLQQRLRPARQWLALDPPEPKATLGGVVATAAAGPRRLRYGTPRDLLIGITVVLADGTVARSGGKVVKNVAGYDLGKLFTGSFGTLGVIVECTFRLHPLPGARRVVVADVTRVGDALRSVGETGSTPTAMEFDGERLTVLVESIEPAAVAQAARIAAAIGGEVTDLLPDGFGQRPWRGQELGLKVTHRLGAIDEVLAAARRRFPARIAAHAGSGVVWLGGDDDLSELAGLRADVAAADGQVVVVNAPRQAKASVDTWGPVRGLDVMRRIKERFDPDNRMAPGSFVGGI